MRRVQVYESVVRVNAHMIKKEKRELFQADFHQWADDFEEDSGGMCPITVALVEKDDGSIVKVNPEMIRFLDRILG